MSRAEMLDPFSFLDMNLNFCAHLGLKSGQTFNAFPMET